MKRYKCWIDYANIDTLKSFKCSLGFRSGYISKNTASIPIQAMIIKVIAALSFVSVLIIGKVELSTEDDLLKQYKTSVEMICIDKGVFAEILYRYIYTVAL